MLLKVRGRASAGAAAGVAMVTSIVSVLTGNPVRKDVAMTGEVTLRGMVLPIGGLKEKLLAALRGGIKTVLIPKDNEKDLADIPDNVKKGLTIIPVSGLDEVLARRLKEAEARGEVIAIDDHDPDEISPEITSVPNLPEPTTIASKLSDWLSSSTASALPRSNRCINPCIIE